MGDAFTRAVGQLVDAEERTVTVGVCWGSVTIDGPLTLEASQADEFAQLFTAACWEAAHDSGLLSPAGCEAGCDGLVHDARCVHLPERTTSA